MSAVWIGLVWRCGGVAVWWLQGAYGVAVQLFHRTHSAMLLTGTHLTSASLLMIRLCALLLYSFKQIDFFDHNFYDTLYIINSILVQ